MERPKLMMLTELQDRLKKATYDEKVRLVAEQTVAAELFAYECVGKEKGGDDPVRTEDLLMDPCRNLLLEPRPSKDATWYEWLESRAQIVDAMAIGSWFASREEFVEATIDAAVALRERLGFDF